MANIFEPIENKRELDKLLTELRAIYRNAIDARDTAKKIILREIKQPEFVRTMNKKLFPEFQALVTEFRLLILEAKEQRSNVQQSPRHDYSK